MSVPTHAVYLVKSRTGNAKTSAAFEARSIDGIKSPVSGSAVSAYPLHKQAGYAMYIYFLAAYMHATLTQAAVKFNRTQRFFPLKLDIDLFLPMAFPPVVIDFTTKVTQDFLSSLATQVGGALDKVDKRDVLVIRSGFSLSSLKILINAGANQLTRPVLGCTNIEGIFSFLKVIKVVTAFLMTHVYPAVISPIADHALPFYSAYIQTNFEQRITREPMEHVEKRQRMETPDEMTEEDQKNLAAAEKKWTAANPFAYYHEFVNAKPSPKNFPFFGPTSQVPFLHGLCFPYFLEMLEPDFRVIPEMINRYFKWSLGSDEVSSEREFGFIKSGNMTSAPTYAGMQLQHLLYGIHLAIETQTRLFVVIERALYLGFVLLGCDFNIWIHGKQLGPRTPEELKHDVERMSTNTSLLVEVVDLVNCLADIDEVTIDLEASEIKSARQIWYRLREKSAGDDDKAKILVKLQSVTFETPYLRVTPENIIMALDTIYNEGSLPAQTPMFVYTDFFNFSDKELEVLSLFGPSAFSMLQFKGKIWEIRNEGELDPADVEVEIGKSRVKTKALPQLYISVKPLVACANDMRHMIRTRSVSQGTEASGASKNIRFAGADRDAIWGTLKKLSTARDAGRDKRIEENRPMPTVRDPKSILGKRTIEDI